MPWWTAGSGKVELRVMRRDAEACTHPGPCDADVEALRRRPYIAGQLAKIAPEDAASTLREYGAWDTAQLADHEGNLLRLLWIACGDIVEDRT